MSNPYTKLELSTNKGKKMKETLKAMSNDIHFVKVMSVYGYVVFSGLAFLAGLYIGVNN